MTPFEAKGWTKDTKFKVVDKTGCRGFEVGAVVWLDFDDSTLVPRFTDGRDRWYCSIDQVEPIATGPVIVSVNGQSGGVTVSPETLKPTTKDTIFNLKLTGEELVYLAVALGQPGLQPTAAKLDNSVYCKAENVLLEFAAAKTWIWAELEDIDNVINKVFPPQETPEQKQYKELLAQREALDAQLAQLSQKLNLKEEIGGV